MNLSLGDQLTPVTSHRKDKLTASNRESSLEGNLSENDDVILANNTSLISKLQIDSMAELMRSKARDPVQILTACTAFSTREVKMIYRNFKQDCPNGLVTADILREIYIRFYPFGNPSAYAFQVFRTLDYNQTGAITFKEFLIWLSTVSRGNITDKLNWIFNFYDINGDGFISKDEISTVVRAIYLLLGDRLNTQLTKKRETIDFDFEEMVLSKTNSFFHKFNPTSSGLISLSDFIQVAINDPFLCSSLEQFHTII